MAAYSTAFARASSPLVSSAELKAVHKGRVETIIKLLKLEEW